RSLVLIPTPLLNNVYPRRISFLTCVSFLTSCAPVQWTRKRMDTRTIRSELKSRTVYVKRFYRRRHQVFAWRRNSATCTLSANLLISIHCRALILLLESMVTPG